MRVRALRRGLTAVAAIVVGLSADPVLAEVADKVEGSLATLRISTGALLLLAIALAATGWRRALWLWPVTVPWGLTVFGTVWEWREALQREGAGALVWEGAATTVVMMLAPPLLAGLARRGHRMTARSE